MDRRKKDDLGGDEMKIKEMFNCWVYSKYTEAAKLENIVT